MQGDAGMLLHIDGRRTMENLKFPLLSQSFILSPNIRSDRLS